ncbi:MAG: VOC family protein [Lachnospiraceae bacterium]|nr:VOC family protein [Lachnospiraceae bacterium]
MKYCWTTIYVKDIEESIDFYQELLGLKICNKFNVDKETEIVMLGLENNVIVELICNKKRYVKSTGISMGFEVDSIDDALAEMIKKGITIICGPFSPTPKSKFFFIQDPDGVEIQIVQNII